MFIWRLRVGSAPSQIGADGGVQSLVPDDRVYVRSSERHYRMPDNGYFQAKVAQENRRTTLPLSLPMWRSRRRETVSSRSPARSEHRSTRSLPRYLKAVGDPREVLRDPDARYLGGRVEERSLVPLGEARLGSIGFDEWFRRSHARA
jgi:hypothetical protein